MGSASISISISSVFNGDAFDKANSSLSKLSGNISRASKATASMAGSVSSDLMRTSNQVVDFGDRMQKTGKQMADVGDSLTKAVTVPMVALGTYAGKAAVDFDTALSNVRKTTNMTEAQLDSLAQSALEMSQTQPVSAETILNVEALGAQLGISQENLESFAQVATGLDIATDMNAEQAATEMARFANITQMSEGELENYASTLVYLGNNFATTESEISSMAQRFASAGTQAGLSQAQILGLSAAMSSLGIKSEMGGSALSRVFVSIQTAVSEGGDSLNAFAEVAGMSAEEFRAAWEDDAAGAFTAILDGVAAADDMNIALTELGITNTRDADTMRRLAGNTDLVKEALDGSTQAWEENSALTNEVDQRNESLASRLEVLKNKVDAVAINVGGPLVEAMLDAVDALEPMFQGIADAAQAFADMDEEGQRNILMWAGVAAAAGPALSVFGRVEQVLGGAVSAFGRAGQAVGVYSDALATADGSALRTYASDKSLSTQLGVTKNSAVQAAGGVENYVAAWENMHVAAGQVEQAENRMESALDSLDAKHSATMDKMHDKQDKLMQSMEGMSDKQQQSTQKRIDALNDEMQAAKTAYETERSSMEASYQAQIDKSKAVYEENGRLITSWTNSTEEMEKASKSTKRASGQIDSLQTSVAAAADALNDGSISAGDASKSLGNVADNGKKAGQSLGTTLKNGATLAMGSLKSMAIEGLKMGAVAIAIAGVTAAVGAAVGAYTEWKERQDALTQASQSFDDVLARVDASAQSAAGAASGYSLSLDEVAEASRNALDDTNAMWDKIEDSLTEVGTNSALLDTYVATIDELANKSGLSASEQVRLKTAVEGYNEVCGTAYQVTDATNGKIADGSGVIQENTEELDKNAEAWKRNADAQAAQQAYLDVQKQHLINQENLAQAQEKYNEVKAKEYDLTGASIFELNEYRQEMDNATTALENAEAACDATSEQLEGLGAKAAVAGSALSDEFVTALESLPTSMQTVGVDIATNLSAGVEAGSVSVQDAAAFISETVNSSVGSLPEGMQDKGLEVAKQLSAGISSGSISVGDATEFLNSAFSTTIANLPTSAQGKGMEAVQSLVGELAAGNISVGEATTLLSAAASGGLKSLPVDLQNKGNEAITALALAMGRTDSVAGASAALGDSARGGVSTLANDFSITGTTAGSNLSIALSGQSGAVGSSAGQLNDAANSGVSSLPGDFSATGSSSAGNLASAIGAGYGSVSGSAGSLSTAANSAVSGLPGQMGSTGSSASRNFASGVGSATGTANSNGSKLASSAKSGAESWSSYSSGSHLGSQFASGIGSAWQSVKNYAISLVDAAKSVMGFSVPKEGPWSGAEKGGVTSGLHLAQNWARGIELGIPAVEASIDKLSGAAYGTSNLALNPSFGYALPSSKQAGTVTYRSGDSYSYVLNIDGARLESASSKVMEAMRVIFSEIDMGVA